MEFISSMPTGTYSVIPPGEAKKWKEAQEKEQEERKRDFREVVVSYRKYTVENLGQKLWVFEWDWGKVFVWAESAEHALSIVVNKHFNNEPIGEAKLSMKDIAELKYITPQLISDDFGVVYSEE